MKSKLVIVITIFILVACKGESTVETPQTVPRSVMVYFPYANSTDIYTPTARYALDGSKKKGLNLIGSDGLACSILCVDDKWLYYYADDEEGTGNLKRIPLRKGEDNRDIVDVKRAENIRDTQYENGFTVVGNYYAGISYGTVGIVYNMNTGETVRCEVPKALSYSKDVQTEDKYWCVLEQGKDWVLWEGEHGVMLQKIPTGELWVVEKGNYTMSTAEANDCVIYSTDELSCYLYDTKKNNRKLLMEENEIRKAICSGLNIAKRELSSYYIDKFMVKEDKFCMQLKVKITKNSIVERKYVVLSQMQGANEFVYDKPLNAVLKNCFMKMKNKADKQKNYDKNIRFVMNVGEHWFLEGNRVFCYNEKTDFVMEIDRNDPEWNICFAICKVGLEDV